MRYEETIKIERKTAEVIKKSLAGKYPLHEDEVISRTAVFADGKQVDVKCCGVQEQEFEQNYPWAEAVLFSPEGSEIACSTLDDDSDFFGDWEFECRGDSYVVHVLEEDTPSETAKQFLLTEQGRQQAESYIAELKAKRKEILDAGKDTADDTTIPSVSEIEDDIAFVGVNWDDPDGPCYYNGWGVTDHYDADYPLLLKYGRDFVVAENTVYDTGFYLDMEPGMIVQDLDLHCFWKVISNNGTSVILQNVRGGLRGARIEARNGTCSLMFLLLDRVESVKGGEV